MKRLVTILIILISATGISQDPIEKTIGEFTEVKIYDLIEVELIKSDENKIIISGNLKEEVFLNNKNGTLKIKMGFNEIFNGNKTKVKLYYNKIDLIDVNEGAKVHSNDTIKQFEIDLKAQEGGFISVPINVSYANIKATSGGVIKTSGSSKKQNISILTGGVYQGETLETENTEVIIKAAGEAHVNAKTLVDVKIRVGGDVYIYGNPETVNESRVIGGRVKRM